MIFRKTERKKWPMLLGVGIGALAVVGAMSIKNKGNEMMNCVKSKMMGLTKKKSNSIFDMTECEIP